MIKKIIPPYIWDYINGKLPADSLRRRFARGVFWTVAGNAISQGLALVSSILVARILGKTGFGEYGMINSTVGMFGLFAGMGLGLTNTKYVAEFRSTDPARAGRIISLTTVIAVVTGSIFTLGLLIFAPYLAEHTINAPHLAGTLRIASGLLILGAVNGAQIGALSGFEAFKTIAWVGVIQGVISFPLMVAGAYYYGVKGVVAAMVVNIFLSCVINRMFLVKYTKENNVVLDYKGIDQEVRIFWKFSLPTMISGVMVTPVTWLANSMLVNMPNGYAELGLFNAANQWKNALMILPNLIGRVVTPILSEKFGIKDLRSIKKALGFTILANGAVALPVAILLGVLSPFIMKFYGKSFTEGWPVMIVVLLTALLLAIQVPVGQMLAATGKMWLGLFMNVGWAVVFISSFILLKGKGAYGMSWAFLIGYMTHAIWTFGYVIKIIGSSKYG